MWPPQTQRKQGHQRQKQRESRHALRCALATMRNECDRDQSPTDSDPKSARELVKASRMCRRNERLRKRREMSARMGKHRTEVGCAALL